MMNKAPKILLDGFMYQVHSIDWYDDNSLCLVSYYDSKGDVQTIFNMDYDYELGDMLVFE